MTPVGPAVTHTKEHPMTITHGNEWSRRGNEWNLRGNEWFHADGNEWSHHGNEWSTR